jgi:transposase
MTEAGGVPVAVVVDGANRRDLKMARETVGAIADAADRPPVAPRKPQGLCLDKDYDYAEVYALCAEFAFTAHVVARGTEAAALKRSARKRARRWAVERTHSWMNRFRGILVRWSKRADNYLALLHFVCALITLRGAGLSG